MHLLKNPCLWLCVVSLCAVAVVHAAWEGDVAPRPDSDGKLLVNDWVQVGRFVAGLDTTESASEFQRADCAPHAEKGDGVILVNDWVQAGRYVAGLDAPQAQGGPTNEGEAEIFSLMLGLGAVDPEYVHGSITAVPEPIELCPPLPGQPWCGLYLAGTEVHLTPVPNEGYEFSHWTGDLSGSDVPGIVEMDGNKHVIAEFAAIEEGEPEEGEGPFEGEGEDDPLAGAIQVFIQPEGVVEDGALWQMDDGA